MDILYVLQQSIYNNDGKWLTADSNIQMMRGIFKELLNKTDWNFHVLVGKLDDFADIKSYKEIVDSDRVHFIEYNFPVDAFLNRQNFDVIAFDKMFKQLPKIDIVWNNITELSRNIKTYLYYKKYDCKLITTCFWLDAPTIGQEKVPQNISYDWRQFDGFECSDLAVFTCDSTNQAWYKNARNKFCQEYTDKILEKSTIWDFGYSSEELDYYKTDDKFDKKTILFLNRMSGINYTHHLEFIEALKILKQIRKEDDWQVVFTNPSQKMSWEFLKTVPNIHIAHKSYNRQQYAELLWRSDISVHLYETELYGGCAHREAVHCDNYIVSPKLFEYANIQGKDYPFYLNEVTPEEIARQLNNALNANPKELKRIKKDIQKRNKNSSFEVVSKKVIKDIKLMMKG
jgi:hypothetical protein